MDKHLKWLVPAAVVIALAALWYFNQRRGAEPATPAPAAAVAPAPAEPGIQYPVIADTEPEPLPVLDDSDSALKTSLELLFGAATVGEHLNPKNIARRVVSTVDNLPRAKLAVEARSIRAVQGEFVVMGNDEHATLMEVNYQRYRPLVQALQMTDAAKLAAWYRHFYPLFQEAYVSLGYPSGYFNDRLIAVIDHLLATPELQVPPQLVRRKVFYEFADPALESRSAGQKTLMRMGPENTAAIKRKLQELRAELAVPASRP